MSRIENPLSRTVLAGSLVLLGVGLGLHAFNLKQLYDDAILNAERTTRNLALAFAEHTARTFESADRALLASVALHERNEAPARADAAEVHEELKNIARLSDVVQSLGWADASGRLIASSAFAQPPLFSSRDLEHFSIHRKDRHVGLFIGKPFVTQLSGAWVVPLSRRLSQADDSFTGVASGFVDLSYFGRLYNSMSIGTTQTIALIRRDGTFLMREPRIEGAPGQSIADSPLFMRHLPSASQGTFIAQGRLDDLERIISYATVPGYPLVVTVGLSHSEALTGWWRQLTVISATFVAFLALFLVVTTLLIVYLERDEGRRREIEIARQNAEDANRAKSDFLSNMSHELRTPLNAILGYAEVIRDQHLEAARDERHRAYAGHIHDAGVQLLGLINGLLDLSKIEANRWPLRESPVNVRDIVEQVISLQRLRAVQSEIELVLDVPLDLPAIEADAQAVTQMLLNLLSNAIKFTPRGGRVEIRASLEHGGLTLAVRDTGIGIPDEIRAHLFERFTQSTDPLVRTDRGAGLGLWIVKRLIELHGGTIGVASRPNAGTEVTLYFPPTRTLPVTRAA